MDKQFLQTVFSSTEGQVYRFTGTIPEGEDAAHYLCERYTLETGDNCVDRMVVDLPGGRVLYVKTPVDNLVESPDFELIADLVPDVIPEVIPETPTEE